MKFKKLDLIGFKSFVEKTTVIIEKGLTDDVIHLISEKKNEPDFLYPILILHNPSHGTFYLYLLILLTISTK